MSETEESRKARLKALRQAATKNVGNQEDAPMTTNDDLEKPKLKFRNYNVKDETIRHDKIEQTKAPEFEGPQVDLEKAFGEDPEEVVANVAPKKPNWDLRRDIANKLAKLERRTQHAISELAFEEEQRRMKEAQQL